MTVFIDRPSPNFDARADGAAIDMLVLHYTGMRTADEALERLCDPVAKVSAHYTIDTEGRVFRHVDEALRARHAGVSFWSGERDVNSRSIGIELVNPGHEFGYVPFAEPQIAALIALAHGILARHSIPPRRVLGHSDVAPSRKMDPGELFPWSYLAERGIGHFPSPLRLAAPGASPLHEGGKDFAEGLAQFGYGVAPRVEVALDTVVRAFQRHFRPEKVDGIIDGETEERLALLLQMAHAEKERS